MTKRNVAKTVFLSIITLGFYNIYWYSKTAKEINNIYKEDVPLMDFDIALLLGIITFGYYIIVWMHTFYKYVDAIDGKKEKKKNTLITVFFFDCISVGIVQKDINLLKEA